MKGSAPGWTRCLCLAHLCRVPRLHARYTVSLDSGEDLSSDDCMAACKVVVDFLQGQGDVLWTREDVIVSLAIGD